ncbi:MAG: Bug family tripartite tricarboxylate transporter substrate binding protein [Beijerinckiaceae bacterium]
MTGLTGAISRRAVLAGAAAAVLGPNRSAHAAADFAGKTITMVVGFPPGGGVDTGARVIARHLPRFLAGNPSVVIQNMPGAGGVASANWLYTKAPKDGLTVAVPGRDWPLFPLLFGKGGRFEPLEFAYIGSSGAVNTFVWLAKSLGLMTPERVKASKKDIVFGGLTPSTQPSMIPKILAREGYPMKAVSGYRGTGAIINAIEKGEVHAVATNEASFARRRDLIEKTVRVFQLLRSKEEIPVMDRFVSDTGKKLLALSGYASATGMPLVAPPQAAPERVDALRAAFAKMSEDKQFGADSDKIGAPWGKAISGEEIRTILKQSLEAASPDVLKIFREIAVK